jgi:hypothetical protein
MVVGAKPRGFGIRPKNERFLDLTYYMEFVLCSTEEVMIRIYCMPSFSGKKYEESLKMTPFEMIYDRRC